MSAAIAIRSATEHDLRAILDIYNEAIENTTAVYNEQPHTMEMRRTWFNDKLRDGFPAFVAEHNGQVIGFSSLGHFRAGYCYHLTVEISIYVHHTTRGKGIGKALLEHLIATARQMKFHSMIAGIDSSNTVSIALHQSFGFKQVALFKQVGFKFGQWLDLKFMQLVLE